MATKCCSGGNECNHVVTIGYLKSFVNVIGEGNIVSINNSDNTYCPTYGELTGGTLVVNHSNGSTPNGDVDGIVVGGSYASNQLVNQKDISLVYTRFKSLIISASKTSSLNPCGDSSTLSYTHTYTRYTRAMTNACETVDDPFDAVTLTNVNVNDTSNNEVSWSIATPKYGSISYPTYTIGKNGNGTTTTPSRYDDITASITFRGTKHNSNTIRITQSGLGGGYVKWYQDYTEYYSYDNYVISPSSFDCNGGAWTGTGYYTRHDWWVYRWQDGCNVYHDDVTTTGDDVYTNKTEVYNNGTVPSVDCSSIATHYHTSGSDTYHGYTASWSQDCDPCSDCSSVSLSPTSMSWQYNSTSTSSATYSYTAAGISNFRTACTDTTNFTVTHNSSTRTITVKPNSQNSTLTPRTATVTLTYDTPVKNDCTKTIGLTQGVQSCNCGDLTIDTSTMSWAYNDSTQKTRTYTKSNCITDITASSDNNWFSVDYATAGQIKVKPSGSNTTMTAKTGTVTVSYIAHNGESTTQCSKTFGLNQGIEACTCDSVSISPTSYSWSYNDTTPKDVTITSANCITSITTGGSLSHFTASLGSNKVTVRPNGNNISTSDYAETLNITYSFGSPVSSCTKTVSLTQTSQGCSCGALTMSTSPMSWGNTDTTPIIRTYTLVDAACVGTITATTSGTNGDKFTVMTDTANGNIRVAPIGTNTTANAYNATVTLTYAVNGIGNCTILFNVSQNGTSCGCNDLTMDSSPMSWGNTETTPKTKEYTIVNLSCISSISAAASGPDGDKFTASVNTSTKKVTVAPIGTNTTLNAYNATVTLTYTVNGVATPCTISFNVSQAAMSCSCTALTMDNSPMSWGNTETTSSARTYTIVNASCIGNITVYTGGTDGNKFTASVNTSTKKVTVAPIGTNTTLNAYNATVTLTYTVNGVATPCTISFNVSQAAMSCSCTALTMDNSPMSWGNTETTSSARTYTIVNASCIGNITVYTGGTDGNKFTASVNTSTKKVTVAPIGTNTTLNAYNGTITLEYEVNGLANPCEISFNVSQAGTSCGCNDFSIDTTEMVFATCETTAGTRTATLGVCNTITSVQSSSSWFTASVNGSTIRISASPNDSDVAKTATITVNFTANGSACTPKTFTVRQPGCNDACSNITDLPDSISFDA